MKSAFVIVLIFAQLLAAFVADAQGTNILNLLLGDSVPAATRSNAPSPRGRNATIAAKAPLASNDNRLGTNTSSVAVPSIFSAGNNNNNGSNGTAATPTTSSVVSTSLPAAVASPNNGDKATVGSPQGSKITEMWKQGRFPFNSGGIAMFSCLGASFLGLLFGAFFIRRRRRLKVMHERRIDQMFRFGTSPKPSNDGSPTSGSSVQKSAGFPAPPPGATIANSPTLPPPPALSIRPRQTQNLPRESYSTSFSTIDFRRRSVTGRGDDTRSMMQGVSESYSQSLPQHPQSILVKSSHNHNLTGGSRVTFLLDSEVIGKRGTNSGGSSGVQHPPRNDRYNYQRDSFFDRVSDTQKNQVEAPLSQSAPYTLGYKEPEWVRRLRQPSIQSTTSSKYSSWRSSGSLFDHPWGRY